MPFLRGLLSRCAIRGAAQQQRSSHSPGLTCCQHHQQLLLIAHTMALLHTLVTRLTDGLILCASTDAGGDLDMYKQQVRLGDRPAGAATCAAAMMTS